MTQSALVWFRRDLRATDHAALHAALLACPRVHCAFVFDRDILDALDNRADRRVEFIHASVVELRERLRSAGGDLVVLHGSARTEIPALARRLGVAAVYTNRDYEPAALERDAAVSRALDAAGIAFRSRKDQVVFERDEVRTRQGGDFSVFTPYKRAWLAALKPFHLKAHPTLGARSARLAPPEAPSAPMPALADLGFRPSTLDREALPPGESGGARLFAAFRRRIDGYRDRRDFPALNGPSYLSVHLRFGTVSIRELVRTARRRGTPGAETWLSELIWREFYFAVLAARPDVVRHAFRPAYDALAFDDHDDYWQAWCEGRTGYPLVDAAMRQLNQTGYMHNRLRMIAASFLVKDLGIDWRRGERYFAAQLNDYDLAANNGGWQWAASTGCDAQPWFRIFNPVTQSKRFDAAGAFIRRYVPELAGLDAKQVHAPWTLDAAAQQAARCRIGVDYPAPVVDHAAARQRTLERYGRIGKAGSG